MGRLIDIDVLFDYFGNDAIDETTRSNIEYFISEKGTVEAIPKADYENRLKADMVAMLEVIKLRIDSLPEPLNRDRVNYCIQEKINALKGETDDK